ncbi:MAG: hypothetical protein M3R13_04560 [Armatimonadota bacterium]|nr:hypothetical protein [Armatimonadota bacterium]
MKEKVAEFSISAKVNLEGGEDRAKSAKLYAYAFGPDGALVAQGSVKDGKVELTGKAAAEGDIELYLSPSANPDEAKRSMSHTRTLSGDDFKVSSGKRVGNLELMIRLDEWILWFPFRFCVDGHIRKRQADGSLCPLAFVKVEIFDVDREWCWWRWLRPLLPKLPRLPDRYIIPIPDLIREKFPVPPIPDPGPYRGGLRDLSRTLNPGEMRGFNPQPDPPYEMGMASEFESVALNPQPLPPKMQMMSMMPNDFDPQPDPPGPQMLPGMMKELGQAQIAKLRNVSLTSRIAPWFIFPRCFYSKREVCETFTDCSGYFRCCFRFFPWHVRNGHFRFDRVPDVIIKVTQTINGVDHVIYMDPYTNTRWNAGNAHIDVAIDDPDVICGGCGDPLEGTNAAAILQVATDPLWNIDATTGKHHTPTEDNAAFTGTFTFKGAFTDDLRMGAQKYYLVSYRKFGTSTWFPIQDPLNVLRALPFQPFNTYFIGPQPSGPTQGLYEIQDRVHWWMNPGPGGAQDALVQWISTNVETDDGRYEIKLEVFDGTGSRINTVVFPNHIGDGSGVDPNPVPSTVGEQVFSVVVDNHTEPPEFDFSLVSNANMCGVIPFGSTLDFWVLANQDNGRIRAWDLNFAKGMTGTAQDLADDSFPNGVASVNQHVSGAPLLAGLTGTCAFALTLHVWPHLINDGGWHTGKTKPYAIAVERCICPPATDDRPPVS